MRDTFKRWWPTLKRTFTIVLILAIGYRFAVDLRKAPHPSELNLDPLWMLACGLLYLVGLAGACCFWMLLLYSNSQRPSYWKAIRAYFLGHLGKYVPGKAWALILRTTLVSGPEVRVGVAVLTTFYEVLSTMASGALLAFLYFLWSSPDTFRDFGLETLRRLWSSGGDLDRLTLIQASPLLVGIVTVPIVPWVFNRLVRRMSNPFLRADAQPLPELGTSSFFQGLVITSWHWLFLGASLCVLLRAFLHKWPCDQIDQIVPFVAMLSFSYVAGFVVVFVPNGLLVRELMLAVFLAPELIRMGVDPSEATGTAALAVLLLRLVWSVSEVLLGAAIYFFPPRSLPESP